MKVLILQSHLTGIEIRTRWSIAIFSNSFNRTLLELKFPSVGVVMRGKHPFNRTLLELKFTEILPKHRHYIPSIAPYWNWNVSTMTSGPIPARLQSHLTGIEIEGNRLNELHAVQPSIAPYWNWNGFLATVFLGWIGLQSHLTGIEIVVESRPKAIPENLQSHLTGIEILRATCGLDLGQPFNRTLLELKWMGNWGDCLVSNPFNRTLLELK